MKRLIIAGSAKLQERAAYWRGYFEGRGYEVIDYPGAIPWDKEHASEITDMYCSFYQNLDRADVFFLMNEDKDGIGGYIGPSAFSELTYTVIGNLNHGRKVEINLLQMPSEDQRCYEEVNFWLSQGWVKLYDRPTGKKATIPVPDTTTTKEEVTPEEPIEPITKSTAIPHPTPVVAPAPTNVHTGLFARGNTKNINLKTCKKRCLRHLSPEAREYLQVISPEFPAWLLKYIAAPEFQRLAGISPVSGSDNSNFLNLPTINSVYTHSIGVALIVWRFTHDKKQTLAGLFHDIASPAFKHCIDFMNGDAETQESTEERTSEIIRNSRAIMRQLKKDEILAGEVSDYHLYPIADNDVPNLAADRLEYTLSNGYFLLDIWSLEQVKRFIDNIAVLKNENDIDELGFLDLEIAKEFVKNSLPLFSEYRNEKTRASMQFIADIIKSMELKGYLTMDDLYIMNEREIVDWILSCGDKTLGEAFRQFQRATSVYSSNTAKKDRYCTGVKVKTRYVIPLVATDSASERITDLSSSTRRAIDQYLDEKLPKYVGFDFEFTPYTE